MIDRQAIKSMAKLNMSGRKPSVFFVAAVYIVVMSILSALVYALSGFDQFLKYMNQVIPANPNLTQTDIKAFIPVITPAAGVLILSIVITRMIVDIGFMRYCLKISRNEEADTKMIFDGFALFTKILVLALLQFVFIFLWSFLLIIPGIIAYYSYRQAFYICLDAPEKSPLDCIRQSKRLMNGFKAQLFFLDVSFIGWRILDSFVAFFATIPLFSVWLSPYTGVTQASFYNQLVSEGAASSESE